MHKHIQKAFHSFNLELFVKYDKKNQLKSFQIKAFCNNFLKIREHVKLFYLKIIQNFYLEGNSSDFYGTTNS